MIYDLQKASMWKRLSAALFDGILLGIVAVLCAWLISIAVNYDSYNLTLENAYARYAEEYGVDFHKAVNEYDSLTPEQIARIDEAYAALSADEEVQYAYEMMLRLMLIITSLGILLAYVIMEFTVPMLPGDGQTLGKKFFDIGVMLQDGVRISGPALFIRSILGKYAIETMIPVLIILMISFGAIGVIGPGILLALVITELAMIISTKTNSLIHDQLSSTVCVDVGSQRIFKTRESMIAYKQKLHAERAARQKS